jgi:hypothetical protein
MERRLTCPIPRLPRSHSLPGGGPLLFDAVSFLPLPRELVRRSLVRSAELLERLAYRR